MNGELRAAAEAAKENYLWREPHEEVRRNFEEQATPLVILSLLCSLDDAKREALALRRLAEERGAQIARLETVLARGAK